MQTDILNSYYPATGALNISRQCSNSSAIYLENISHADWAMWMMDASGSFSREYYDSGSEVRQVNGLYDECLAIRAPSGFTGKYCKAYFKPVAVNASSGTFEPLNFLWKKQQPMPITLNSIFTLVQFLGLFFASHADRSEFSSRVSPIALQENKRNLPSVAFCVPSSCSAEDVGRSLSQQMGKYLVGNNRSFLTIIDESDCSYRKPDGSNRPAEKLPLSATFDGPDIAFIMLACMILLLILTGTAIGIWKSATADSCDNDKQDKRDSLLVRILLCFDFLGNCSKILSTHDQSEDTRLSCIHGIRSISCIIILICHYCFFIYYRYAVNMHALRKVSESWWFQPVVSGTLSLDNFLVMGGLLASYGILHTLERTKGKLNIPLLYLHRYLRLTPLYAFSLFFAATLLAHSGSGPNWDEVDHHAENSRTFVWSHLLYINNLQYFLGLPFKNIHVTWYVAVDMQLFVFSPFFVYALRRNRAFGQLLLVSCFSALVGFNFLLFATIPMHPTVLPFRESNAVTFEYANAGLFFEAPWGRAPSYLIGVWVGWYLFETRNSRLTISKRRVSLFWICSVILMMHMVGVMRPYMNPRVIIPTWVTMVYGPLRGPLWAVGMSWVIIACASGYGGFINRFLSWKGFIPLSRVSYCIYIMHFYFILWIEGGLRGDVYYSHPHLIYTGSGMATVIFAISFVVSAAIEAPAINLSKLLLARDGVKPLAEPGNGTEIGSNRKLW